MDISIHSPHTRGDGERGGARATQNHFNPLPSYEGRLIADVCVAPDANFNPLPSYEGRQAYAERRERVRQFQSTPLIRGETNQGAYAVQRSVISIHSPHTRGDIRLIFLRMSKSISIHSPHTRGDSINFQRIHRIQGSLYNTIHFTRFYEFFQPVLGGKNAVYAVRSSLKNHDSFTFAQPF